MRYEHKGGAVITTTTTEVGPADLTIPITDFSGWPDGTIGPFWVTMNKGKNIEEKILCASRSGSVLQVWTDASSNGRAKDNTVARTHPVNSTIEHTWTATEADEANAHLNASGGAHGYPPAGNLVTLTGAQQVHDKNMIGMTAGDPVMSGGTHTAALELSANKASVIGAQTLAEFRLRNITLSAADPTPADGSDGDVWIKYIP